MGRWHLTGTFLLGVRCPSDLEDDITTHSPLTHLCSGLEIRVWDVDCPAGCVLHKSIQPETKTQRKG